MDSAGTTKATLDTYNLNTTLAGKYIYAISIEGKKPNDVNLTVYHSDKEMEGNEYELEARVVKLRIRKL